jgi:D-alanyl-lipoteichoic acid acyltransferase DltB (MBOAT superfamily)
MLFPTTGFALFFLAVFTLAWSAQRSLEWHKILLLAASWLFYGAWDFRFVLLLIASGIINWALALGIDRYRETPILRRSIFTAGVLSNLAVLVLFKYYNFFLEPLGHLLESAGWSRDLPVLEVVLPVGVSFFTFQGMSYLIDVNRRETRPARLLDMVLLMSFFPHLVAGPIVRASHLIPQLEAGPKIDRGMAAMGFVLILTGLFKKTIVASYLATDFVDPLFAAPASAGSFDLLLGAYGYAVQIYCDFSGYSDMAIGCAALLGYRFPSNFNQPYRAGSLQDFWRRWHISLSSWLRDYLYISLGGSRKGQLRTYGALALTMVLGGLWHGANLTFLVWGMLHGGILAAERFWQRLRRQTWPRLPKLLTILITFHIVTLAWIFFRAQTVSEALSYLSGIAAVQPGNVTLAPLGFCLIALGFAFHAFPADITRRAAMVVKRQNAVVVGLATGLLILGIDAMRPYGIEPFIYFQF